MSSENNNNFENSKKIIKYVQEHAAGLTLLATVAVTVGSILLKYIYYVIELGYTNYFNISSFQIDISDDNILYGIVANGVIALFFILISAFPYFIWQGKGRKWCKVLKIIFITLIPEALLIVSVIILAIQGITYKAWQYIIIIPIGLLLGLTVFSIGYFLLIDKKIRKKEKNEEFPKIRLFEDLKRTIFAFLVLIVLESVLIYGGGYFKAATQNEFKIIETTQSVSYVILYETDDSYIVSECEITDRKIKIDKNEHKQISKDNIKYIVKQLKQITG